MGRALQAGKRSTCAWELPRKPQPCALISGFRRSPDDERVGHKLARAERLCRPPTRRFPRLSSQKSANPPASPGGYIDHDEDWKHAVVRELGEETGIAADERDVRLADALSAPDGHLLLFGLLPQRPATALPPSRPTDETAGFRLLRTPAELAFPLHTRAVRIWFDGGYR
ncbi:hypothetical protein GCM10009647_065250 [Streptomyces sanglieri]|uniref:NUDIX domain-containing protein n=1 Tax=Streptomyces sanglieri TaxID=193460 RepID=A0ABW2X493_9ACTN